MKITESESGGCREIKIQLKVNKDQVTKNLMKTKTTPKIKIVKICKHNEEFVQKLEELN